MTHSASPLSLRPARTRDLAIARGALIVGVRCLAAGSGTHDHCFQGEIGSTPGVEEQVAVVDFSLARCAWSPVVSHGP